jgi:hypothetical protein
MVDEAERDQFKKQIYGEINTLQLKHALQDKTFFVSSKRPELFPDWVKMVNFLLEDSPPGFDEPSDEPALLNVIIKRILKKYSR